MATPYTVPQAATAASARTSMLGSLVAHAGLVTLATLAAPAPPPAPRLVTDTAIIGVSDARPGRPSAPGRPAVPRVPGLPRPPVFQLPGTLPPPDLPHPPVAPGAADPWPGVPGSPGDTVSGGPGGCEPPLDARIVEEPPQLLAHPALRYPEVLRQAGIEGVVLVEAVLDTLGRVESGSARVTRGAQPLMDAEALSVVLASRYRPGRTGDRAVRLRILVPVRFALRR